MKANSPSCILSYKKNLPLTVVDGVPYGSEIVVNDTKLHLCVAFRARSSIWQMENRMTLSFIDCSLSIALSF